MRAYLFLALALGLAAYAVITNLFSLIPHLY
jgi:hypothetical protein